MGDPYDPATWGGDDGDLESHFLAESVEAAKLPHANQVLQAAGRYGDGFDAAFGASSVTIQKIAQAIGAYCQSLRSGTSPYDRFAAGDTAALSGAAQRGLALFQGKAGCVECHDMGGKRAPFSDYGVHDTGIAWKAIVAKDDAERKAIADAEGDAGAGGISGKPKERRAFKTPTLRDVARRGPYMHDGSLATLEAVVRHYMKPVTDPNLDKKVTGFSASGEEVADLVSFLRSLSSDVRPGLASTRWDARAKTTKLRFVDAKGAPLAGFSFLVAPAGDALPGGRGAKALHLVTDDMGLVEYVPFLFTHGRLVLPDGLRPLQGTLVPDSCRSAKIIVPVEGKTRLFVTYPKGAPVAAVLVGEHREAASYPDRRRPRIAFRQEAAMPQADGRAVVLYSAWFRTDVPMPVTLRLPKRSWGMDRLRMIFESEATKTLDLSK